MVIYTVSILKVIYTLLFIQQFIMTKYTIIGMILVIGASMADKDYSSGRLIFYYVLKTIAFYSVLRQRGEALMEVSK